MLNKALMQVMLLMVMLMWVASPAMAGHTNPEIVKGSMIIGKTVQNMQGKKLGKIEDFAIDELEGEVQYAVLSFGGVLGVGEKYFAIPWEALQLSDDHKYFLLDVDEKALARAPGFNRDKWPDFADPVYYASVYEFYRVPLPEPRPSDQNRYQRNPGRMNKATE